MSIHSSGEHKVILWQNMTLMAKKFKIGILGSTGYTGATLADILVRHPNIEIKFLGSQQYAGKKFTEVYPGHKTLDSYICINSDDNFLNSLNSENLDLIFFATPNGIAHKQAPLLIERGIHVIDLSADYRFRDLTVYEQWYGFKREDKEVNAKAIYGLVEFKRSEIKKLASFNKTMLIGNPGCYTTSAILALGPALEHFAKNHKAIKANSIIIDGKSGISGAGRKAELELLFTELNDSCSPYKLANTHRHGPEVEMFFTEIFGEKIELSFSPHLVPMSKGLLTTSYIEFAEDIGEAKLRKIYSEKYSSEQFITLLEPGIYPQTKWAVGFNNAFIQISYDPRMHRATITCAIDNLVKGAAGQAVQNMNLVFGLEESLGLV